MSWSDDRFKSTFHRVKAPCEPGDYYGERYSIAFFNQPCKDAQIQGPLKKYSLVTGEKFTRNAMQRNFAALQAKLKRKKKKKRTVKVLLAISRRLSQQLEELSFGMVVDFCSFKTDIFHLIKD
jgi:isopenicillin N synthase-like dioxygenase